MKSCVLCEGEVKDEEIVFHFSKIGTRKKKIVCKPCAGFISKLYLLAVPNP